MSLHAMRIYAMYTYAIILMPWIFNIPCILMPWILMQCIFVPCILMPWIFMPCNFFMLCIFMTFAFFMPRIFMYTIHLHKLCNNINVLSSFSEALSQWRSSKSSSALSNGSLFLYVDKKLLLTFLLKTRTSYLILIWNTFARGVHPPKSMVHIADSPISPKN